MISMNQTEIATNTFLLFTITGNHVKIASAYYETFMQILRNIFDDKKEEEVSWNKINTEKEELVFIETTENVLKGITVNLEYNNAKMVIPLINFFSFDEYQMKGVFHRTEDPYLIFGLPMVKNCFDFFLNGNTNIIGFKKTKAAREECCVEYS